jgi:hypothetical protein
MSPTFPDLENMILGTGITRAIENSVSLKAIGAGDTFPPL